MEKYQDWSPPHPLALSFYGKCLLPHPVLSWKFWYIILSLLNPLGTWWTFWWDQYGESDPRVKLSAQRWFPFSQSSVCGWLFTSPTPELQRGGRSLLAWPLRPPCSVPRWPLSKISLPPSPHAPHRLLSQTLFPSPSFCALLYDLTFLTAYEKMEVVCALHLVKCEFPCWKCCFH